LFRGLEILVNLLRALATRYATFTFDREYLTLDIVICSAKSGHRFIFERSEGKKPSQDLRQMINELGELWWEKKRRTGKRYRASQHVLDCAAKKDIPREWIEPLEITRPHAIGKSLRYLKLTVRDLNSENARDAVKTAYRRQALKHHPDCGGSERSFHDLHSAYQELVSWLDMPKVRTRRGLPGKWCFDGKSWRSPLRNRTAARSGESAARSTAQPKAGFQDI